MNAPLLRLFFALPCPTDCAESIERWRASTAVTGTVVAPANLHVTLVFLGAQPEQRLPQLIELASLIRLPAFELNLDRLDLWPDGLLHLAPSHTPDGLVQLAGALRQRLQAAEFAFEQRAYRPHLTLARQSGMPEIVSPPSIRWVVREFGLFSSEHANLGVQYRALASWPLG